MAVTEHVLLPVKAADADRFEAAIAKARVYISRAPGFRSLSVQRPAAAGDPYLLLVGWQDIESHRNGFRKSAAYQDWRSLLHGFYEELPKVTYYEDSFV